MLSADAAARIAPCQACRSSHCSRRSSPQSRCSRFPPPPRRRWSTSRTRCTRPSSPPTTTAAAPSRSGRGRARGSRPTATSIAYQREGSGGKRELMLAAAAGGGSKTVLTNLQDSFYVTFSPDSKLVAAVRGAGDRQAQAGPDRRHQRHRAARGRQRLLQRRQLLPGRHRTRLLACPRAKTSRPRPTSSRATVAAGKPVQITKDGNSLDPLWGPTGKIVFVKQLDAKSRKYGPEERALPDEPVRRPGQAPHPHQGRPAAAGPLPDRLVGQRQPAAGRVRGPGHQLRGHGQPEDRAPRSRSTRCDGEQGFVGTALSKDGTTVLGFTGGFEPGPNHKVATVPYGGGKAEDAGQERLRTRLEPLSRSWAPGQSSRPTWRRIETLSE